jgi:branched-chain amino acid transport system ATP-binding protein
MRLIMRLCERIQVLDSGRTICVGTPDAVRSDPAVLTAYLGSTARGDDAVR